VKASRIQPRPLVELETITLRLPAELVRAVDDFAKHLGGSSDRTYVITKAIELAIGSGDTRRAARSNGSDLAGSPAGLAE
jgi:predicted transcriptional regulator